jgi:hypothetical protein
MNILMGKPIVGKKVLVDKTVIPFWYKVQDQLMKHQLKSMVSAEQLEGLQRIDLTIIGDHGGGTFHEIFVSIF